MAKNSVKASSQSKPNKKSKVKSAQSEQFLREQLAFLLKGGGAHIVFDDAFKEWPQKFVGMKVAKFPHTAWMLLEHMRVAQWDILEFSRNPKHVSPPWPDGYWTKAEKPPSDKAWAASVTAFKKDLRAMAALVSNPKSDLAAPFPWAEDGQTLLREALLLADHNAYHLAQLVMLRKSF